MIYRSILVVTIALAISACAGSPRRPGAASNSTSKTLADRCASAQQRGIADPACPGTPTQRGSQRERLPAPAIDIPTMPAPFPANSPVGLPGGLRR